MKKLIILCTITICATICGAGYYIACTCGNGAYSISSSYLDVKEWMVLTVFTIIALVGLVFAIKDSRNKS